MITYINAQNAEKYSVLFAEASNAIGEQITSLDEYFGKLSDLTDPTKVVDLNTRIKFTKLPLDEGYCIIDANTRRITIPADFQRNGAGVINDEKAEVLFFQIDRYFDYTDLFSNDINIIIQWQAPDGTSGISGAYGKFLEIESVDNNTANKEKVVFGWIIDSKMTAAAGRLRFAVHFVRKDASDGTLDYALNTMPADLTVNSTLAIVDTANFDEDDFISYNENVLNRITSNGIYDLGGTIPSLPVFAENGLVVSAVYAPDDEGDFVLINGVVKDYDSSEHSEEQRYSLMTGDSYTNGKEINMPVGGFAVLQTNVSAVIGDLTYQWLFIDSNNIKTIKDSIENYSYEKVDINSTSLLIPDLNIYYYLENEEFKKFPYVGSFAANASEDTISFNGKTYELYTKVDSEKTQGYAHLEYKLVPNPEGITQEDSLLETGRQYYREINGRYEKIIDNIYVKENADEGEEGYSIGSSTGDKVDIYEQNVIYVLRDNANLVGTYTLKASSKAGINTKESELSKDNGVIIKAPKVPEISSVSTEDDHIEGNIIHRVLEENSSTTTLAITTTEVTGIDNNFNSISYQWKRNEEDITGATSSSCDIDLGINEKADFNCVVTYTKNHASTSATSNTFIVSVPASTPAFTNLEPANGVSETTLAGHTIVSAGLNLIGQYPFVTFNVDTVEHSDTLQYVWVKAKINEFDNGYIVPNALIPHLSALDLAKLGIEDDTWLSEDANTIDELLTDPINVPETNKVSFKATEAGYYYCILINKFNTNVKTAASNFVNFHN